jgi:ATP-dependent Clp protease adapter protein ClpS
MNQTLPELNLEGQNSLSRWMTLIYNDDHTPYDLVVLTIIAATQCTVEEAEIETWEAHHYGRAPIHFASEQECEMAAQVMRSIGVKSEVLPEWTD